MTHNQTLKIIRRFFWHLLVNKIASSILLTRSMRCFIYKLCGMEIRTRHINARCCFEAKNVKIGMGSFINYNCFFDGNATIEIGDNVAVAHQVMFCTSTHKIGSSTKRAGEWYVQPITVGNGCWIGARSTILPGVSIGAGCVIAAGSMVLKDCEPNCLYAGIPAKKVKELDP